jgi:hypothetical protein
MALIASAGVALAGPPLLCHPFDIGPAKSLTWDASRGWMGRADATNMQTLVADTEALLTPDTPIIVRMETLRRAALYASRDAQVAPQLLQRLQARAQSGSDPLAMFDAGYLIETYRQIGELGKWRENGVNAKYDVLAALVKDVDGYAMVQKSLTARSNDPAIEFASALIASSINRKAAYNQHAVKARANAHTDPLVARNIGQISGTY